jgi:phosphoribosyl-ATP pyrophosphohydrolase
MTGFALADLERIIAQRAASDDPGSYTRTLVQKGVAKCAQKLGEEAVETAIAAVERDPQALQSEAADLLYHLLVVLHVGGVPLDAVLAELGGRSRRGGLEEKAARPDA